MSIGRWRCVCLNSVDPKCLKGWKAIAFTRLGLSSTGECVRTNKHTYTHTSPHITCRSPGSWRSREWELRRVGRGGGRRGFGSM
jgi:hypothetical protein